LIHAQAGATLEREAFTVSAVAGAEAVEVFEVVEAGSIRLRFLDR
jgi:hypothetical protein